jgi:O-antigen ligase
MNQSITTRLSDIVGIFVVFILVLLPFHEFLTTWIGSNFGHLDAWRVWKELLILLLTPPVAYIIYKTPKLRKWFRDDWVVRLVLVYALLAICLGVWSYKTGRVNKNALADGLITDLRFPIFFIITAVTAYNSKFLKKYWQAILLIPASLVVVFGITQLFLPIDFLRHFGYGPKTIPAYETVDQNTRFHRIQSTLRGANPLGAYLIVVIPACFIGLKKYKWLKLALALASIVALFFTYSRSAYVGVFLSLIVLYYLVWLNHKWRKQFMIACSGLAIVFVLLIVAFRYNSVAQDVLFHTSKSSKSSTSSNAQHLTALKLGLHDVLHQPFGEGPGTAGPASVHNNHPPRIAENYYVQVAQEMGLLGVAIFVAINIMVGLRLWQRQKDPLASLLLASLIGISLVNLVSHAWADDTLSLLWWGMAGIALTPAIIKKDKLKKA